MFKTATFVLTGLLIAGSLPNAAAQIPAQTLVVVDTALNVEQSVLAQNIVHEVCILEWSVCPNGTKFMEGSGAASLPSNFISSNGFDHGRNMVSAAVKTYPGLQIVFIRVVGNSSTGSRLNVSQQTIALVLKWVSDNKSRFNIAAVAMSQGHHGVSTLTRYCPRESMVENMVKQLRDDGVPFFVPTGNSRDYDRIDWPACIPESISIAGLTESRSIASYSNLDNALTDYFEVGKIKVLDANNKEIDFEGTSVSVQVAAAKWMKLRGIYPNLTTDELFQKLDQSTTLVSNHKIEAGKAFPMDIRNPDEEITIQSGLLELNQLRYDLAKLYDIIRELLLSIKR